MHADSLHAATHEKQKHAAHHAKLDKSDENCPPKWRHLYSMTSSPPDDITPEMRMQNRVSEMASQSPRLHLPIFRWNVPLVVHASHRRRSPAPSANHWVQRVGF